MNNDLDFSADAVGAQPAESAKDDLARVAQMATTLTDAQRAVGAAELKLEEAERVLTRIEREEFPELLREVGIPELTLEDRRTIKLDDDIQCGITEERAHAAFKWLRDNKFDGLISTTLSISFAKGEEELAQRAVEVLRRELKLEPEVKDSIHWQTLKSFLKEQIAKEAAEDPPRPAEQRLPRELFGVHEFSQVKVKHPRGSGGFKLQRVYKKK